MHAAKEKESILTVLTAGLVKNSSGDVESSSQLQNLQVNNVPDFLADAENTLFMQVNKRDLRVFLEKQFPDAFKNPIDNSSSTKI